MISIHLVLLTLVVAMTGAVRAQESLQTQVLVVGGGVGGTAAAIQLGRMGVPTILVEPGPWLGGMLSAAGVSAVDGNHALPSGIWGEFRQKLYERYGGARKLATGWVSETQFEPRVADSILKSFCAPLSSLKILYGCRLLKVVMQKNRIAGAEFVQVRNGSKIRIHASQTIDATELGDLMAAAQVPFDLGMEADSLTKEGLHIKASNDIIQDLTYTAILKDYGPMADCTVVRPDGYDPRLFDCSCSDYCSDTAKLYSRVDKHKMLAYGKLPGNKYMINWPSHGNDYYLNLVNLNEAQRQEALKKAKARTLQFIYFIQQELGFKNLGLADDEFPTADRLPLIPYHREGRRLRGIVRFKVQHIARPFDGPMALYRTGISVGDYPIDHHHRENQLAPQHLGFYPVPSFNIPLGALIPASQDGLIVAEKGISVSNAANGTTRLQPVVMLTGQAAGALAGLAVKTKQEARLVPVRQVQWLLLQNGAYLMPYYDASPQHPHFLSIQRIGATGILRGRGEPYHWANRTWFYPDSAVQVITLKKDIAAYINLPNMQHETLQIRDALTVFKAFADQYKIDHEWLSGSDEAMTDKLRSAWPQWQLKNFEPHRPITRAEFAVLLDKLVDPFWLKQVDHAGNLY